MQISHDMSSWRAMHMKLHIILGCERRTNILHSLKSSQFCTVCIQWIHHFASSTPAPLPPYRLSKLASRPDVGRAGGNAVRAAMWVVERFCCVCIGVRVYVGVQQFGQTIFQLCCVRKFACESANLEHFETLINCFRCRIWCSGNEMLIAFIIISMRRWEVLAVKYLDSRYQQTWTRKKEKKEINNHTDKWNLPWAAIDGRPQIRSIYPKFVLTKFQAFD